MRVKPVARPGGVAKPSQLRRRPLQDKDLLKDQLRLQKGLSQDQVDLQKTNR